MAELIEFIMNSIDSSYYIRKIPLVVLLVQHEQRYYNVKFSNL